MKRKYFTVFDAFRFFFFFLVFLQHTPISKNSFFNYFSGSGGIGVSLFFILSGFLITYILINEKKHTNTISLKKFFIRRILRIWPLFYAMLLFAFLTPYILNLLHLSSSNEGYEPNWLVSVLFLENYKMMFTNNFPNVSPLRVMWSLCVEEHFYIFWGLILYLIPIKRIPLLIFLSILTANLVRVFYYSIDLNTGDLFSNLDYFAYGAIPAFILTNKKNLVQKVSKIPLSIKYSILILTIGVIFIVPNIPYNSLRLYISPTIFGLLFATIILFSITETNQININSNNLITKLGVYTYGLYVYHAIVINLLIQVFKNYKSDSKNLIIGVLALILTITISILSYYFYEQPFLKLKKYFR